MRESRSAVVRAVNLDSDAPWVSSHPRNCCRGWNVTVRVVRALPVVPLSSDRPHGSRDGLVLLVARQDTHPKRASGIVISFCPLLDQCGNGIGLAHAEVEMYGRLNSSLSRSRLIFCRGPFRQPNRIASKYPWRDRWGRCISRITRPWQGSSSGAPSSRPGEPAKS